MSGRKPKNPKSEPVLVMPAGIYAGHRDIAERLSADYFLTVRRTTLPAVPQLLDMDRLTELLVALNPEDLEQLNKTDFGKGFMMGILYQMFAIVAQASELSEDDFEE